MEISNISPALRKSLAEELNKLSKPELADIESATAAAMQEIARRILEGERGLFDPTNSGDNFALALGAIN